MGAVAITTREEALKQAIEAAHQAVKWAHTTQLDRVESWTRVARAWTDIALPVPHTYWAPGGPVG